MKWRSLAVRAALLVAALFLASCGSSLEDCMKDLTSKDADVDSEDRVWAAVELGEAAAELMKDRMDEQSRGTLTSIRAKLGDSLSRAENPLVRAACARALLKARHPKAAELLINALDDLDPTVRSEAVMGLGFLERTEAAPRLAGMLLEDDAALVRKECARQLGRLRAADQVEALIKALTDRDQMVRVNAEKSLAEITCRDLGSVPEDWQAWLADFRSRTGRAGEPPR